MNRSLVLILVLCLLIVNNDIKGQDIIKIKKTETFKKDKKAYKYAHRAQILFEQSKSNIYKALKLYLKANETVKKDKNLNYNIGICYLLAGPKENSLEYFNQAEEQGLKTADLYYYKGVSLKINEKYDDAIRYFEKSKKHASNLKDKNSLIEAANTNIARCEIAKKINKDNNYSSHNLKTLNSKYDDYSAVIHDSILYFCSREVKDRKVKHFDENLSVESTYQAKSTNGKWNKASRLKTNLSKKDNFVILSGRLGDRYTAFVGSEGSGDLYFVKKKKTKLVLHKAINFVNTNKYKENSISFTADGKQAFFVSNRKGGLGQSDIYYSRIKRKNKWTKPKNLGSTINSKYNELDVFISAGGDSLYFSSNGKNSMGGYDIFYSTREGKSGWSKPKNLGEPYNSSANDINFFKDNNKHFYISSDRKGGTGGYDIYSFVLEIKAEETKKDTIVETPKLDSITLPTVQDSIVFEEPIDSVAQVIVEKKIEPKPQPVIKTERITKIEPSAKEQQPIYLGKEYNFRIQIIASEHKLSEKEIQEVYQGKFKVHHSFSYNLHKYTVGLFKNIEKAEKFCEQCGVKDAFVVLYKGNMRLGDAKRFIFAEKK
ncbi:MAG: hypothetical protein N4A49_03200 [Marinifilaceae bacterium]|nr:hypothetical protein [Marinifilaceae bacterium]